MAKASTAAPSAKPPAPKAAAKDSDKTPGKKAAKAASAEPAVKDKGKSTASRGAAKKTAEPASPAATAPVEDHASSREQRVREAAYHRWVARGQADGDHERDWLEAEREVDGASGHAARR